MALLSAEIEAHYALHRLSACLGEPIEVKHGPAGRVIVQGLVSNADRKKEILKALQSLPLVTVQIQTVEEALNSRSVQPRSPSTQDGQTEDLAHADGRVQVRTGESPIQNQLEQYFAKLLSSVSPQSGHTAPSLTVRERITEFSNQTASLTQLAMAEAWALQHLAAWYPLEKTGGLPTSTKWLLDDMFQDHLNALQSQLAQWRELLEPVLLTINGNDVASSHPRKVSPSDLGAVGKSGRAAEWSELFHCVEQMERLTLSLLNISGAAPESAEESVQELLTAFGKAEIGLQALSKSFGKEFSGRQISSQ